MNRYDFQIRWNRVHFCERSRSKNSAPRSTRSKLMPMAMPVTPMCSHNPNSAGQKRNSTAVKAAAVLFYICERNQSVCKNRSSRSMPSRRTSSL